MLIVEGWVRLENAGEIERLREAAVEVARATKAEEPGCLDYACAIDLADPTLLRIVERWTDEASVAAHFQTPHVMAFSRTISDAKIVGASVNAYSAEVNRTIMER